MTSDRDPYTPIDCDLHSQYELAIMQHHKVNLRWHENGTTRQETVLPVDLITREGMEFLKIRIHDEEPREIRLDRIVEFEVRGSDQLRP